MADAPDIVILDDRLLIEHLLVGLDLDGVVHTTSYWYYRACRAAVLGAGGHLSGPFANLDEQHQNAAIRSLLSLPDGIDLPDPRSTIPVMAEIAERHPRLNLLNLEATAAGRLLGATVLFSLEASRGVLSDVLDAEHVPWRVISLG